MLLLVQRTFKLCETKRSSTLLPWRPAGELSPLQPVYLSFPRITFFRSHIPCPAAMACPLQCRRMQGLERERCAGSGGSPQRLAARLLRRKCGQDFLVVFLSFNFKYIPVFILSSFYTLRFSIHIIVKPLRKRVYKTSSEPLFDVI